MNVCMPLTLISIACVGLLNSQVSRVFKFKYMYKFLMLIGRDFCFLLFPPGQGTLPRRTSGTFKRVASVLSLHVSFQNKTCHHV